MREATVDRAPGVRMPRPFASLTPRRLLHVPSRTVRLRLTLLYGGLFLISGVALLAITYLIFRSASGVDLIVQHGSAHASPSQDAATRLTYARLVRRSTDALHQGLLRSVIVLGLMTAASIGLSWLVAGRPLREMTATARQISERNLNERLAISGPRDELKDLADTVDGLLGRLEVHVAGQQRFAANASHELRTPLAITKTLLDVASNDPSGAKGELVDRLSVVNTRAIDLTEALLLLSRADQRSFVGEHVELSLVAEEATETLLRFAEERGVTIETSGDPTPAIGSHALLLQMTTNLVHNAIVHNLTEQGTVWVTTSAHPESLELTVENTGETLTPQMVSRLSSRFTAVPNAYTPGAGRSLVPSCQASSGRTGAGAGCCCTSAASDSRPSFAVDADLRARLLERVGDRLLEAEHAPFAGSSIPCVGPATCGGWLEERLVEPGVERIVGFAVAVCLSSADEPSGPSGLAGDCGDRSQTTEAFKKQRPDDHFAAEREFLAERVRGGLGVTGQQRGQSKIPTIEQPRVPTLQLASYRNRTGREVHCDMIAPQTERGISR
jgi:two-component system sensor histidine kinase VanS